MRPKFKYQGIKYHDICNLLTGGLAKRKCVSGGGTGWVHVQEGMCVCVQRDEVSMVRV